MMIVDPTTRNSVPPVENRELLHAFERAGEPFFITDTTGMIKYVSSGIETLTGFSSQELISKNARIFRSQQTAPELYRHMWTTILSGKPWTGLMVNRKKNGQKYLERLTILPILDTSNTVSLFYARKEEINASKTETEEMPDAFRESERNLRQFLSFVDRFVEEMRSSLNAAKGFTDVLVEDVHEFLDPVKQDYVAIIRQTHQRMLNTLDDVLTIARLDVGDVVLQLEPVQIAKEMKRIISDLSLIAEGHNIRVIKVIEDKGAMISIDRRGLQQVVFNLVSNALKFTEENGYITFGLNVENSHVLITVIDTGLGIGEDFKPRIFEPFSQEEIGYRSEYEGTGLGLTITKRLIELMGGSISFESRKYSGTSFMLRFPVVGWAKDVVASHHAD